MKKILLGIASAVCVLGVVGCSTGDGATTSDVSAPVSAAAVNTEEAAASAAAALEAQASAEASAEAAVASLKAEEEKEAKEAAAEEAAAKKRKAAAKERIANAKPMSKRDLARLVKKPDSATGDVAVFYGTITQFDAATGECIFRANISHAKMYSSWKYEHNSIFVGGDGLSDCPKLDDFIADDEVKIVATSMGSYSYDTQAGGNTTVPKFKVEKISLLK
ncbi:hypothetical protein [Paeniglutamicibacter psychrophenolicus]|uniref:hypothetical protein n=1 Tax=Paeniglutamicibacter psychrophenolicus TaxID=257454 RepID=UPI00278BAA5C|nr:hypothetical protein [Paeniglutamicibacter psychrophenolicus]MDQ0096148.1 hypothetical protein [Paeniglutamicibacter psychrophenolicus]